MAPNGTNPTPKMSARTKGRSDIWAKKKILHGLSWYSSIKTTWLPLIFHKSRFVNRSIVHAWRERWLVALATCWRSTKCWLVHWMNVHVVSLWKFHRVVKPPCCASCTISTACSFLPFPCLVALLGLFFFFFFLLRLVLRRIRFASAALPPRP